MSVQNSEAMTGGNAMWLILFLESCSQSLQSSEIRNMDLILQLHHLYRQPGKVRLISKQLSMTAQGSTFAMSAKGNYIAKAGEEQFLLFKKNKGKKVQC